MTDEKQQPEGKGTPVPEDSSSSSPMAAEWMFLQPGILDLMHDAVIVSDLRGDITGCNKAAERMFGYPAPDLIHKNVSVF